MMYFHIFIITITVVVPKSHSFFNVAGESEMGTSSSDVFKSTKIQNSTYPYRSIYNRKNRKFFDYYDDVAYESWYKPHRDFHARPIYIINRIGILPEISTRIIDMKRRPASQRFYRIFIKDSPNIRINHFIQTGLRAYERNFVNGVHSFNQNAMKRNFNNTFVYGTVLDTGVLSDVPQRVLSRKYGYSSTLGNKQKDISGQGIIKSLKNTISDTTFTGTIPQELSFNTVTNQTTSIPKVDSSDLLETDREGAKKWMSTIKNSPFEYNVNETLMNRPNITEVKIQTREPFPEVFTEPYSEMPSSTHAVLSDLKTIQLGEISNISEKLYSPTNTITSRTKVNPQGKTSHITELPKYITDQVPTENGDYLPEKFTDSLDSTKSTHTGLESIKIHLPGQSSSRTIDFQKFPLFNPKSERIDLYNYNEEFIKRTSPMPGREATPQTLYGILPSLIQENGKNSTSNVKQTTQSLPAKFHDSSEIYSPENLLKWRKGYAYPVYGKHSSQDIIRRKMILNMKSELYNNAKFLAGNEYLRSTGEADKLAQRAYSTRKYCEGLNCGRITKSTNSDNYFDYDFVYGRTRSREETVEL